MTIRECPRPHVRVFTSSCRADKQSATPASYYRGGTSRGVIFQRHHLPADQSRWPRIFLQVMGSPDPHGRQLDGFGAGVSSLSKICVVAPSEREDADVDYTFVGIGIENDEVDIAGNCGNMSAAIGPYAFNQRLLRDLNYACDNMATVKIHNTNTGVIIKSCFPVADGEAQTQGSFSVDGVSGLAAQTTLEFLRPSGSKTGRLLPTGNVIDKIAGVDVSCIDAANPCVFVRAADLEINGTVLPNDFNKLPDILRQLEDIRYNGAVAMGICKGGEPAPRTIPKVAIVSPSTNQTLLSGKQLEASQHDLVVRFISDTQPHRAIPLTGALCTAAAAKIKGSVVQECLGTEPVDQGIVTIGHPSGRIAVTAVLDSEGDVESATVFRTARRIMEGQVFWND